MITLRKQLMGGYRIEDHHQNLLGIIKRKFFSPRFIIVDRQGNEVGHTDICVQKPRDITRTALENTSYTLVSKRNGGRLAIGLPAYNENVDVSNWNTFSVKPPLTDRMSVLLPGTGSKLFLRIQMDGSAVISENGNDASGSIKRLKGVGFSMDMGIFDDSMLLCGIFLFTRYLLAENDPMIVV